MKIQCSWLPTFLSLLCGPCFGHDEQGRDDLVKSLLHELGFGRRSSEPQQEEQHSIDELPKEQYLGITYNKAMQPLIRIAVAEQMLDMVFSTGTGNTFVFAKEKEACSPPDLKRCYSFEKAFQDGSLRICAENSQRDCKPGQNPFSCQSYNQNPNLDSVAHFDQLGIDGVPYNMHGVEVEDLVLLAMHDMKTDIILPIEVTTPLPFRLLLSKLAPPQDSPYAVDLKPPLFEGTGGLFGAAGPALSCRGSSIFYMFLILLKFTSFALDFRPPQRARFAFAAEGESGFSRVLLLPQPRDATVWSEPKQLYLNSPQSGFHGFVLYHPTVCGADLLLASRNISSSNWFVAIDTSGPCLTLPPFLFDRLMAHIPVQCPFKIGEPALGRLCAPDRNRSQERFIGSTSFNVSLPALSFTLEDERRLYKPTAIPLPLERLVFDADPDGSSGKELLCVARSDAVSWDMMYSYISFGSLAVAAVNTEIDLLRFRVGLSPRGNASLEATDDYCSTKVTCESSQQVYDESSNKCEDPRCSRYMFMTLDTDKKICTWNVLAPVCLGVAITSLAFLDFFSHSLYKTAINRAKDTSE